MQNRTFLFTLLSTTLITLGIIAILPRLPGMKTDPEAAYVDGLYRLKFGALNRLQDRRIYVVSGSSSLYSLDTKILTAAIGTPVVNLATHAGLGLPYILDRAGREMKLHDTIIFTPEYPILGASADPNQFTLAFVAFFDRPYIASRPLAERANFYLGYGFIDTIWETLKIRLPGALVSHIDLAFDDLGNARGNSVAKSSRDRGDFTPNSEPLSISADAMIALRKFSARARDKHVQIISFPASLIHLSVWDTPEQRSLRQHVRSTLQELGMNPHGDDQTGWVEPSGIFDAMFHANDVGRAAYTHRIAILLCAQMTCAHPPR
jgi:hypothetical protein